MFYAEDNRNSASLSLSNEFQSQQNRKENVSTHWHLSLSYPFFLKQKYDINKQVQRHSKKK